MEDKIKLEDDPVLFIRFKNSISRGKMIQSFNRLNIYTVEDLMNADTSKFTDIYKKIYTAIIYILRYAYLGEPFKYDYILRKTYKTVDQLPECAKDLEKLGIVKNSKLALINFADFDISNRKEISMEELLSKYYLNRKDLADFYVRYINYMKRIDDETVEVNYLYTISNKEIELQTLNNVIEQLNKEIDRTYNIALINFRTSLEVQAKDKQNELNLLYTKTYSRRRQ